LPLFARHIFYNAFQSPCKLAGSALILVAVRNRSPSFTSAAAAVPPHAWFGVSAIFHYLGPSFAVLLFSAVGVLGVAWLRIATAALVFAPWTKPWRTFSRATARERVLLLALGGCLALMNTSFYLALDRLPMSVVAAIEFVGTIGVALYGLRTRRNLFALALVVMGVFLLIDVRWSSDPVGLFWAFLNGTLFVGYILLGHKIAEDGASGGVERLGAAMAAAFLFILPIGFIEALRAFANPMLLFAGFGVGICSSVIPYICDQLAMSRLPRASFALLLALLPAMATVIGAMVLAQVPGVKDVLGVLLVMAGVAVHTPAPVRAEAKTKTARWWHMPA
jgi:inner membrane transporter RhtA